MSIRTVVTSGFASGGSIGSVALDGFFAEGVAAVIGPSRPRRSISRRKKKSGVIWLEGMPPVVLPQAVPQVVKVTFKAREAGADRAIIWVETRFLPVTAHFTVRESYDTSQITVQVTGIGYDEDDLEVLAIAMGPY